MIDRKPAKTIAPPASGRAAWRPLSYIQFTRATAVPGVKHRVLFLVPGQPIEIAEPAVKAPQPYYDPEAGLVVIRDRFYPLTSVESFSFARAAINDGE